MSTPAKIRFKRGDTFLLSASLTDSAGSAIDLTGWDIHAQVRNTLMTLIAEAAITVTDAAGGTCEVLITDTTTWVPRETYALDIQYTGSGGTITSTETMYIIVLEDITQ